MKTLVRAWTLFCVFALVSCAGKNAAFQGSTTTRVSARKASSENLPSADGATATAPTPNPPATPAVACTAPPFELPAPGDLKSPEEVFSWKAQGATQQFTQVMATPVVADVSGNGLSIIFPAYSAYDYVTTNFLYSVDARTGKQQWVVDTPVMQMAAALGDIDGDGQSEIFAVGLDGKLVQFDGRTGKASKTSSEAAVVNIWVNAGVSLADVDGDGKAEIIAGNTVFDNNLAKKYSLGTTYVELVPGPRDESGKVELISNQGMHRGASGETRCSFARPIGRMAFGQISKDDPTQLIIGSFPPALAGSNWGVTDASAVGSTTTIIAYRASDCKEVFSVPFSGGGYAGLVTMADLDGDQNLEFGVPGVSAYSAFRADGSLMWKTATYDGADYMATGSTSFDLNGDGRSEILYNSVGFLKIMDGRTGDVVYQIRNSNFTISEMPVVVDLDGDGHAEIVAAASAYTADDAGIRVFRDSKRQWVATRPVWNQAYYNTTNVSDTGAVAGFDPAAIWKDWLSSAHLAGYRNNIPRPAKSPETCRK